MDPKHFFLTLFVSVFYACNTSHNHATETAIDVTSALPSAEEPMETLLFENEFDAPESGCRLHFDGLEIYMPSIVAEGYSKTEIIDQDTLFFGLSTESGIINEAFTIMGDLADVEVLEMENQCVAVYHGDNVCLLDQWKIVSSPWRHMHVENGEYISFSSLTSIKPEFPEVSAVELQEAVRSVCAENSEEFYESIKSPLLPPCEIFTRSRTIRVSGKRIYTGQPVVKHLIFYDGFGC